MSRTRVKKSVSPAELWFCGALLGLGALCFTLFGWLEEAPKFDQLRRGGVTADASILRKINFTQSCEPTRKGIARTCRIREFHLRFLVRSSPNQGWRYGTVSVSESLYQNSQEGQIIKIVYLLEGSTDIWLASDVQNFTMLWYNLLGVFGAFAAFFCTTKAVLSMRHTKKGKIYA